VYPKNTSKCLDGFRIETRNSIKIASISDIGLNCPKLGAFFKELSKGLLQSYTGNSTKASALRSCRGGQGHRSDKSWEQFRVIRKVSQCGRLRDLQYICLTMLHQTRIVDAKGRKAHGGGTGMRTRTDIDTIDTAT
jgi:hypothetical protein